MNRQLRFLFVAAVAGTLAACSKTRSDDVKTGSIVANYTVKAVSAAAAECSATFQVGGETGTFLELSGDDRANCNGVPMSKTEFFGIVSYQATVPTPASGIYTVVFLRADERYDSTTRVPEAITNPLPAPQTTFQKGTPINVSWQAASDPKDSMWVTLNFESSTSGPRPPASSHRDSAPENGLIAFSGAETQVSPPVTGSWGAILTLRRERGGSMPEGLKGSILGFHSVTIPITLVD